MAVRKRTKSKPKTRNSRRKSVVTYSPPPLVSRNAQVTASPSNALILWGGWIAFSLFLILLIGFGAWKRNWVVAALVNNKPVWGWQVLNALDKNYRSSELDNIINNRLIMDEARKRNSVPTSAEVDTRYKEQEDKYGGAQTFAQLLSQYGKTTDQVKSDIKLQLSMEKMFGSEVTITDADIDNYIKENKKTLTAIDSVKQREEAKSALHDQKQQEVFGQHFNELKTNGKIRTF